MYKILKNKTEMTANVCIIHNALALESFFTHCYIETEWIPTSVRVVNELGSPNGSGSVRLDRVL